MDHFVITIQREFGSLGRPIAKRIAQLLNVEFYDRDIVEETAKKMDMPVSVVSDHEERGRGGSGSFFRMLFPLGTDPDERKDKIFMTQSTIIESIAMRESCVIVGRCADYILQDHPNALHVYIYASYEDRLKNCIGPLGMKEDDAKSMIADVDKARRAYHLHYAKYAADDPEHKDIIINSSRFDVEGTAQILACIARKELM